MTIPTLIANYQKHVTVQDLKKTFAMFQEAVKLSEVENGEMSGWEFPDISDSSVETFQNFTDKYLAPYLKVSNKYKIYEYYGPFSLTNTRTHYYLSAKHYPNQLMNGVIFSFFNQNRLFGIWVDLNGNRKPNMMGKDVFVFKFNIQKGALEMEGMHCAREVIATNNQAHCIDGDFVQYFYDIHCQKIDGNRYAGGSCGALIQKDGWTISKDYPW